MVRSLFFMGLIKRLQTSVPVFGPKFFVQSLILRVQTDVQSLIFRAKNPCAKLILNPQHRKLAYFGNFSMLWA